MKGKAYLLFIFIGLSACEYKDLRTAPAVLVGKWQLIQLLADPGDGSGVFTAVNSTKTISFFSDSTFQSTGPMCQMSMAGDQFTSGTYSPKFNTITPIGCNASSLKISYIIKDDYLIVYYPCIEACAEKYAKW